MKSFLYIFVSSLTILFCANANRNKVKLSVKSTTKDTILSIVTINNSINAEFPFGCVDLKKIKYPKKWEGDLLHYAQLKKPAGNEFENIEHCHRIINRSRIIASPTTSKIEHVTIGDDFKNTQPNIQLLASGDSCRFRLPNIGIFECYYSFQQDTKSNGLYGNLLLLDPKKKNGKILNVYL